MCVCVTLFLCINKDCACVSMKVCDRLFLGEKNAIIEKHWRRSSALAAVDRMAANILAKSQNMTTV